MSWKCKLEGHTDVVVNNPAEARQWMVENQITDVNWRQAFDPTPNQAKEASK